MIIQSSSVGTSASRRYNYNQFSYAEHSEWDNATGDFFQESCSEELHIREESLSQNGTAYLPACSSGSSEAVSNPEENSVDAELEALRNRFSPLQSKGIPTIQDRLEMVRDIKQKSLAYLLRILFGDDEKYEKDVNKIDRTTTPGEESANNPVSKLANELGQHLGTGWSHYSFYYCAESENTWFATTGTAVTTDGRELSFNISVEMSFYRITHCFIYLFYIVFYALVCFFKY